MSLNVLTQGGGTGGETASIFVTGLDENSTVTAVKDGKTVRGKWVQRKNPAYVVPDGYTQFKYIESTGTQYIKTGYNPNTNSRIEIGAYTTDREHNKILFGSRNNTGANSSTKGFYCWFDPQTAEHPSVCFGSTGITRTSLGVTSGELHHVMLKNGEFAIDDKSYSLTKNSFIDGPELMLFALNTKGTIDDRKFYGRVYYAKLYTSDALVHDYVPARRDSDGAVGMYDVVSSTFYTNAGTGEFIAGEEVPQYFYGYEITIKDYGMWTVTATNGEDTITQDVLVDAAVEYEIELFYRLYLYREGDECEDVTGGWIRYALRTNTTVLPVKNADNMFFGDATYDSCAGTSNLIDLTDYSKLVMDVKCEESNTSHPQAAVSDVQDVRGDARYVTTNPATDTSRQPVEADISEITGSHYVHVSDTSSAASGYVYNIWLE